VTAHGDAAVPAPGQDSSAGTGDVELTWSAGRPVDVRRTLSPHRRGSGDPTTCVDRAGYWRAVQTPAGPATVRLSGPWLDGEVHVAAWGAGAAWAAARAADWLGARDDPSGFDPRHPVLRDAARQLPGVRVGRSGLVLDALVPAILEQKVTGGESRRSFARLVRRFGQPAPGPPPPGRPAGLWVPPDARGWTLVPSWEWHRAGVGPQRSAAVVRAARVASRLERGVDLDGPSAERLLRQVPGVGAWTAAEVRARALGDADAVSVGDAHVPRLVVYALTGRVSDADDEMLAVLAPYAGHRYRVQRLLELTVGQHGVAVPRFGPRYAPIDFRAF
jgi:3-methyladenine DNA glycosylase/8-oxoguanine DNA glycosylase